MITMNRSKPQLVIKPFKTAPKIPDNFEEKTWNTLKLAINAINCKEAISTSKETLYRAVEDLCIQKLSASIYDKLRNECIIHITSKIQTLSEYDTTHYSTYLDVVDNVWKDYIQLMQNVNNIFLYLDRSYALHTIGIRTIWNMGLTILRQQIEIKHEVENKIIVGLLVACESDRQGITIDRSKIRSIMQMLSAIGLYAGRFEAPFITESVRFFTSEGQNMIASTDAATFLTHVEKRLQEAVDMVHMYLDISTKSKLIAVIENKLLLPHISTLIDKGFTELVEGDRTSDLRRMYVLLERVGGLDMLQTAWSGYIRKAGQLIITDEDVSREKLIMDAVITMHDRIDNILKVSFLHSESFKNSMKLSFEYFLNVKQNKPAELLAKYVDKKLRGEKGIDNSEVEAILDKTMIIFKYLQDKDVYEAYYKKLLAKRLLLGKSANAELERQMVVKLKTECGSSFTSKMEGMFQDIELSKDITTAYASYLSINSTTAASSSSSSSSSSRSGRMTEPDMHIQVLTTGFWPAYASTDGCTIPREIGALIDRFNTFYTSKYQGRRLLWSHSTERCILIGNFPKGRKELEVSFLQTIVLLSYNSNSNSSDRLSFHELKQITGIEDGELRRTLQSLACGVIGTRVLTKEPKGKDVENEDMFYYNQEYTNKLYRIKINSIQLKETIEEEEKTNDEIFRDRQYQVDAVIVRTMKARKRLSHNDLIAELFSQLKFNARASDIKKRVESLIEREYLERDRDDNSMYNYLA